MTSDYHASDDYRWLTSADARKWLDELAANCEPLHRRAERLRRDLPTRRVHLLLEQAELGERALEKFTAADRMFFTRVGLQQATDEWLAAYKATKLARFDHVADLCCGIGGDLVALAGERATVAVDRDPVAMTLAQANVRGVHGDTVAARTTFVEADVASWQSRDVEVCHIDPDRRPDGRRTSQLAVSSPSLAELEQLLIRVPNAAVKLAPAAVVPDSWVTKCELEWLGCSGECKQLVAWHGELAQRPDKRRATIIERGVTLDGASYRLLGSVEGDGEEPCSMTKTFGRYVFEPDATVRAARLSGALARRHAVSALAPGGIYLTGDRPIADGCLTCFEVCDVLPLDRKRLNCYLARRGVGVLEIKTRGVGVSPERLRSELKLRGDQAATLIVTRFDRTLRAIIARRCASLL